MGRRGTKKKTDYGTVVFHWLLVGAIAFAIATGLRIATEGPDRAWINFLDPVLPQAAVWTEHLQSAAVLIAVSVAYILYMRWLHLRQRILLDRARLRGLLGRSSARWGTINICLYWLFFLVMFSQLVTGTLLYLGYADSLMVQMHWLGLWLILGYVGLHLVSQWLFGGAAQLLRIFRPARLAAAAPRGRHVVVDGTGHDIPGNRPDVVADTILAVAAEARADCHGVTGCRARLP